MTIVNARRWLLRAALAGVVAGGFLVVLPSCNTPFIPIPPPGDPTFTPIVTMDGMGVPKTAWEVRGLPNSAMENAKIYVFNLSLTTGVIAGAQSDGSYVSSPVDGQLGDRIEIYYEKPSGDRSPVICRRLQSGLARTPCP